MKLGPDGGPWGIEAATVHELMEALGNVPPEAELWKIYTTGNLGVMVDDELVAVVDLVSGEYMDMDA